MIRLGCCPVGFTFYPGSSRQLEMYGRLRAMPRRRSATGLAVAIWSYPRGSRPSKEGEAAIWSIIGRNSFQGPKEEALRLLEAVMEIHAPPASPVRTH
jgi:DhnA family fructose-bisphosphate aldolase class Ia